MLRDKAGFPCGPAAKVSVCLSMQQTQIRSWGQEDPLEEETATHSSILAWRIPLTEEPGGLQSLGSPWTESDMPGQLACMPTGSSRNLPGYSGSTKAKQQQWPQQRNSDPRAHTEHSLSEALV